jgi:hypothetical protein
MVSSMGENLRQTPPNTVAIANLSDPDKEARAVSFDREGKGYLTYDEIVAWYQSERGGALPSLRDVADFLGAPEHVVAAEYLPGWKALQTQWLASSWKGDFHVPGWGSGDYVPAGNVRTGRQVAGADGPDLFVFLVECNLVNRPDFDRGLSGATLVLGPTGFPKERPNAPYGEAVEVPLELYSMDGYIIYSRFGPAGWSPEKKLLVAEAETQSLRAIAKAGGLSFYVRLATSDGRTLFVNRDGVPLRNFEASAAELTPPGQP